MVHLEFGQDRLTEPQPLKTFELAQRAMKLRVNVHDVHGVYNYRLAIQELGLSIDETALGNRPRAWRKAGDAAAAATPGRCA